MAIVRYDPWSLLNQVQGEMNKFFEQRYGESPNGDNSSVVTSSWIPAIDIKEEEKQFVLYADLPGIDPKDIEITMEQNVLTVKGERPSLKDADSTAYKRVERAHGTFYRRFSLPDTADANGIHATGKNGVLEIVIPKHEKLQPRKIAVQIH
jgi:HSP20 family protein